MKRNGMVKWATLLLCLTLVFTLAACGNNNNNAGGNNTGGNTTNNGGNNGGNEAAPDNTAEAPKSDVKLTFWHWKIAFDPGFKAVAEAFKAKTGITVETQATTPDDAYRQKLTAAATAGNLPDAFLFWAGPASGAFDGKALDLTEELNNDTAWKDGFLPSALSGVTVSQANIDAWGKDDTASAWMKGLQPGKIFGAPVDVGAFYTIYGNKKILEDAGASAETPASIEAMFENMKKVKEKGNSAGFVFSAKTFTLYENWFANFVDYMKNGEESFTKFMMGEEKMSDPKHIHVAQFIEDLTKDGLLAAGTTALDIDPADQAFAQGKAAYALGGTFTYASLAAMGMNMDDVISFRVPAYEGSVVPDATVSPFPLVQANVTAGGPHEKEALEFVKFLTSEEGQILYANGAFDIPAVKIVNKDQLKPAINSMVSSLSSESNWWSENQAIAGRIGRPEWQRFHDNMQKIILGESTAAKTAEQFDKDTVAELAKENK